MSVHPVSFHTEQPLKESKMSRTRKQHGFTLVELVVVIAVLGILAAVALPRFTDLRSSAYVSKAQAVLGTVRAASAITKASAMAANKDCASASGESISAEGTSIGLVYCYPSLSSIAQAANLSDSSDGISYDSSTGVITIVGATKVTATAKCQVTYAAPTGTNLAPTIAVDTTGC